MKLITLSRTLVCLALFHTSLSFAVDDSSLPVIPDNNPNFDPAKVNTIQGPRTRGTGGSSVKRLPPAPTTIAEILRLMGKPQKTRALGGKTPTRTVGRLYINFETNSADIIISQSNNMTTLNNWGKAFSMPNETTSEATIILEGHTDSQGDDEYNQKLGLKRARAVKNFFVENYGIPPSRIQIQSRGEDEPYASNSTASGRAVNRRVEFIADYSVNNVNSFSNSTVEPEQTTDLPQQDTSQEEPYYE